MVDYKNSDGCRKKQLNCNIVFEFDASRFMRSCSETGRWHTGISANSSTVYEISVQKETFLRQWKSLSMVDTRQFMNITVRIRDQC